MNDDFEYIFTDITNIIIRNWNKLYYYASFETSNDTAFVLDLLETSEGGLTFCFTSPLGNKEPYLFERVIDAEFALKQVAEQCGVYLTSKQGKDYLYSLTKEQVPGSVLYSPPKPISSTRLLTKSDVDLALDVRL